MAAHTRAMADGIADRTLANQPVEQEAVALDIVIDTTSNNGLGAIVGNLSAMLDSHPSFERDFKLDSHDEATADKKKHILSAITWATSSQIVAHSNTASPLPYSILACVYLLLDLAGRTYGSIYRVKGHDAFALAFVSNAEAMIIEI
ncbi:hypothetical protein EMMF5_006607, partial [Cystobasidiomycetes sp. EMM_F5]